MKVTSVVCAMCLALCAVYGDVGAVTITVNPDPAGDAPVFQNYDVMSQSFDIFNSSNGPALRYAPEGREDAFRPFPGAIEEVRNVMEFSLSGITLAANEIASSVLTVHVNPDWVENIGPGQLSPTADILVWGRAGDGTITTDDFGNAADPSVTYQAVGKITGYSGGNTVSVDVTDLIKDLVASDASWAAIMLQMDRSSLPERSTLATDTTFGVGMLSANTDTPPELSTTAVPEPTTVGLFLLSGLVAVLRRRQRV